MKVNCKLFTTLPNTTGKTMYAADENIIMTAYADPILFGKTFDESTNSIGHTGPQPKPKRRAPNKRVSGLLARSKTHTATTTIGEKQRMPSFSLPLINMPINLPAIIDSQNSEMAVDPKVSELPVCRKYALMYTGAMDS